MTNSILNLPNFLCSLEKVIFDIKKNNVVKIVAMKEDISPLLSQESKPINLQNLKLDLKRDVKRKNDIEEEKQKSELSSIN